MAFDRDQLFGPCGRVKEAYPERRAAGARLIQEVRCGREATKGFIDLNNRFEGNAPETIAAMVEQAGAR